MAILDTIKKKLHTADKDEQTVSPKKISEKTVKPKTKISKQSDKIGGGYFGLLTSPHITEKSSAMQADGKYVFKVDGTANKNEIKKAMESIYKVKVTDVNIINARGKKVRLGKHEGWSAKFKKAVVTLKKGDKIEIGA